MHINQGAIERLTKLREKKKFKNSDWERRGLNPSDPKIINEMIRLTNLCLDELLTNITTNPTEGQVRKTLTNGLNRFKLSEYDTEEKEFIGDEFQKIGAILGLNIANDLNVWLYGRILGAMINLTRKKERIIDIRSFECTKCKLSLDIKVTSANVGTPNFWIIGQCSQCDEYNLLSTGENTGGLRFENFASTEILDSNKNSEEQARTRLEQIKYFRGLN